MNLFLTAKCSDPMDLIKAIALGYIDPALEGQIIIFTCPSGQILNGCTSSTCMKNGVCEPDPREVQCTGGFITTAATNTLDTVYPQCYIDGMIIQVLHKHNNFHSSKN